MIFSIIAVLSYIAKEQLTAVIQVHPKGVKLTTLPQQNQYFVKI